MFFETKNIWIKRYLINDIINGLLDYGLTVNN